MSERTKLSVRPRGNGVISVHGAQWYLSGRLGNELVGLEVDDERAVGSAWLRSHPRVEFVFALKR